MTSMSLNIVIQHLITLMYMSLYNVIQSVMQYEKNNTRPLNKYLAIKKKEDKIHSTRRSTQNKYQRSHASFELQTC